MQKSTFPRTGLRYCVPVKSQTRWQKGLSACVFFCAWHTVLQTGMVLSGFWVQSRLVSLKVIITLYVPHHSRMSNPCSALFQLCVSAMRDCASFKRRSPRLQWAPWQTSLLTCSQKHPIQRLVATFSWANALGLHPTCSLALHEFLGFALTSCLLPLDLPLVLFLGWGRREGPVEAGSVCGDFWQREAKMRTARLSRGTAHCSQQRVWLNCCSHGLAVCPWKVQVRTEVVTKRTKNSKLTVLGWVWFLQVPERVKISSVDGKAP